MTTAVTERLARAALDLHRLMIAAEEIRYLQSPASPREKTAKGADDPTASTALDPRRIAVAEGLEAAQEMASRLTAEIRAHVENLGAALDTWDGRKG